MSHLILHVGLHKTGTSTFQQFCARNRAALARQGVIYPAFADQGYPNGITVHHGLTLNLAAHFPEFALTDGPETSWAQLIKDHAKTNHHVVVSSEEFSRGRAGFRVNMRRLGEIAGEFGRATVQCVLRDQISFLQSVFYENSRFGRPITPDWLLQNALTRNDAAGLWVDWQPLYDHLTTGFSPQDLRFLDWGALSKSEVGVVGTLLEPAGIKARLGPKNRERNVSSAPGPYLICQQLCAPKPVPPALLAEVTDEFHRRFGRDQRGSIFTRGQAKQISTHFAPRNAALETKVRQHDPDFNFRIPDLDPACIYQDDIDPDLRAYAADIARSLPELGPPSKSKTSTQGGLEPNSHKIGLMACFKNEGPWVLEWVAHHKALGFDVIGVASNDCEDLTDQVLQRLADLGHVVHLDQTGATGNSAQMTGYAKLRNHAALRDCEWLMTLDGDELFNPRCPSVQDFVAQHDGMDIVIVSWRVFGDSGLTGFPGGTLADTYTKAARPEHKANILFKALVKAPRRFSEINYHLPSKTKIPHPLNISFDGTHLRMETSGKTHFIRNFMEESRKERNLVADYTTAQINHYATKTHEIFNFKAARGRGVHLKEVRHNAALFNEMNRNEVDDHSIVEHRARTQAILDVLLTDEVLAKLHHTSIALWQSKIDRGEDRF